jgi:hypothetical protein
MFFCVLCFIVCFTCVLCLALCSFVSHCSVCFVFRCMYLCFVYFLFFKFSTLFYALNNLQIFAQSGRGDFAELMQAPAVEGRFILVRCSTRDDGIHDAVRLAQWIALENACVFLCIFDYR